MAVSLSNAFITLFDAEVKQAYQGKAQLVGAVRQRRGVEGQTVQFPKVGKGVATARITHTDVTPMNVGFSKVTCTLADWNAAATVPTRHHGHQGGSRHNSHRSAGTCRSSNRGTLGPSATGWAAGAGRDAQGIPRTVSNVCHCRRSVGNQPRRSAQWRPAFPAGDEVAVAVVLVNRRH